MSEKLFPLDFPPGLYHNGTKTQAAGRWYDGNQIRFFENTIQPIGGFAQLPTTSTTITGVPNAMLSVTRNDGTPLLVIGTTTSLYCMTAALVVTDITPFAFLAGIPTPYVWQLDSFGGYTVATIQVPSYGSGVHNIFVWDENIIFHGTTIPTDPVSGNFVPTPVSVFGIVTTPERFLMVLRGSDPDPTFGSGSPHFPPATIDH